jgi:hypothetical protein
VSEPALFSGKITPYGKWTWAFLGLEIPLALRIEEYGTRPDIVITQRLLQFPISQRKQ